MLPYISAFGVQIPVFPFVLLIAIYGSAGFYVKSKKYSIIYTLDVFKVAIPALFGAALGGRVLSALTLLSVSEKSFIYNLLFGGSVFYGGLFGGIVGLAVACKIRKEAFLDYADVIASLIPLGHAVGRFGCFLNGCCYGKHYSGIGAVKYPVNGEMVTVIPTWFIEAFACLVLFFVMYKYLKNIRGTYTGFYLIAYSIIRFVIEFMRGDEIRGTWKFLSTSQILSLPTVAIGIAVLIRTNKSKEINKLIKAER